jgi:hypothetical protein
MASKVEADRWRDWVMLVLAVWLFVSPWVLRFAFGMAAEATAGATTGATAPATAGAAAQAVMPLANLTAAAWNAWILAIVIGALSIWAIAMYAEWQDWLTGLLGIWLIVAPWVLKFSAAAIATWDHVIVGILVVVLAAWELWVVRHEGTRAHA